MELHEQLLAMEEKFWTEGSEFFREHLTDDALMVLPRPAGVLTRAMTLRSIDQSPRWAEASLREALTLEITNDTAVFTYRATARREGGGLYTARCSSVYVRRAGQWRLAFHQQTPEV